jgi:DNA-binding MarR family transcriptional regulator
MNPDLTAADFRALAAFRHRIRSFLAFSESAAREAGLDPRQHQLLLAVQGLPEGVAPSVRNVAERLQIRHHSAVGLVDRAEAAGLLVRDRTGEDRRTLDLRLTPAGLDALQRLSKAHQQELRRLAPDLVQALHAIVQADAPVRA